MDLASQKPNTDWFVKKITIPESCPSVVPSITGEGSTALPVLSSSTKRLAEVKTKIEGGLEKFVIPDLNVAFVESNDEGPSVMME